MKEEFNKADLAAERGVRFAALFFAAPIFGDAAAKSFLDSMSEFQKGKYIEGGFILSVTFVMTALAGCSVSYGLKGDEFVQEFFSFIKKPARLR